MGDRIVNQRLKCTTYLQEGRGLTKEMSNVTSIFYQQQEENQELNKFLAQSYIQENKSKCVPMLRTETGIMTPVSPYTCKSYSILPPENGNKITEDFWCKFTSDK